MKRLLTDWLNSTFSWLIQSSRKHYLAYRWVFLYSSFFSQNIYQELAGKSTKCKSVTNQCTKELLQGDPNQKLLIQMAITLKICISDPMLEKPKCVSEACIYFQFLAVCLQFSKINAGLQNTFWLYQHGDIWRTFRVPNSKTFLFMGNMSWNCT